MLSANSYVGNFVETKNASIASNSLACHLAYIGAAVDTIPHSAWVLSACEGGFGTA